MEAFVDYAQYQGRWQSCGFQAPLRFAWGRACSINSGSISLTDATKFRITRFTWCCFCGLLCRCLARGTPGSTARDATDIAALVATGRRERERRCRTLSRRCRMPRRYRAPIRCRAPSRRCKAPPHWASSSKRTHTHTWLSCLYGTPRLSKKISQTRARTT